MKIYKSIEEFRAAEGPVVTIGTFDGVHVGHRKILERLRSVAKKGGRETVVLTFHPHPRMVLQPAAGRPDLMLLNTQEEKIALLRKAGIDHLIVHRFTREFSRMSHVAFVRDILAGRLHAGVVVVGYNHQFGRNREGSFAELKELAGLYEFGIEEIPPREVDAVAVSSTRIRGALRKGDVQRAAAFLGYDYMLSGKVVRGSRVGRSIGFPTANIQVPDADKLVPAGGVYAVTVQLRGREYKGMLNIGRRPTVGGRNTTIEVNVLGFGGELYGSSVELRFRARIRDEKKFGSLEALKSQIELDRKRTLELLK